MTEFTLIETIKNEIKNGKIEGIELPGIFQAELVNKVGKASSTVRNNLKKIEAEGLIEKEMTSDKPSRVFWVWVGKEETPEEKPDEKPEVEKEETPEVEEIPEELVVEKMEEREAEEIEGTPEVEKVEETPDEEPEVEKVEETPDEEPEVEKEETPEEKPVVIIRRNKKPRKKEKKADKKATKKEKTPDPKPEPKAEPKKGSNQKFTVFFQVPEELRKSLGSFDNEKVEERTVNLSKDFKKVGTIEAKTKDAAFAYMQNGTWMNEKDGKEFVEKLGLAHASMNVGDILVDSDNVIFRMTPTGWAEVKDGEKPKKKEKKMKRTTKPGKSNKMTRIESAVLAVMNGSNDLVKEADKIYKENGGNANPQESKWAVDRTIKILKAMKRLGLDLNKIDL